MGREEQKRDSQLSKQSISTMRDQIDGFKLQLIVEESNLTQFDFDLNNIVDMLRIKKKQTLKKIETLKSNITVLEKEIKKAFRTGKPKMPEEEEKTDEVSDEESSEEESEESSE